MKINSKNNRIILLFSLIEVALQILFAIKRAHYFHLSQYVNYGLSLLSELFFLLSLFYLAAIIKYTNEKKFILNSFYWFIGTCIFVFFAGTILFNFLNNQFFDSFINALAVISIIYITVILFFIKDPLMATPFRIYACAYIFVTFFDFFIPIATPLIASPEFYFKAIKYVSFLHVVPLAAIAYIVYKSKTLANQTSPAFSS